jgi:hypothetical protein
MGLSASFDFPLVSQRQLLPRMFELPSLNFDILITLRYSPTVNLS